MNTTTAPKYTEGQLVEVRTWDFKAPGQPEIWVVATVTSVTPRDGGMWDVQVRAESGAYYPQIVGRRGGNSRIRAL